MQRIRDSWGPRSRQDFDTTPSPRTQETLWQKVREGWKGGEKAGKRHLLDMIQPVQSLTHSWLPALGPHKTSLAKDQSRKWEELIGRSLLLSSALDCLLLCSHCWAHYTPNSCSQTALTNLCGSQNKVMHVMGGGVTRAVGRWWLTVAWMHCVHVQTCLKVHIINKK